MAKKKARKLSTARGAQAKARARAKRNPDSGSTSVLPAPLFSDLANFVAPGFAGYAGTRLLQRIAYAQLSKRFPKAARHLAAGSGLAVFAAVWFLLHRIKRLEKYHTPAAVGSAIAALQTIVQTYLPKFGWMVSDFQPTIGSSTAPAQIKAASSAAAPAAAALPPTAADFMDDDDLGILAGSTIGSGDEFDDDDLDDDAGDGDEVFA